jgi:hypothetical protein
VYIRQWQRLDFDFLIKRPVVHNRTKTVFAFRDEEAGTRVWVHGGCNDTLVKYLTNVAAKDIHFRWHQTVGLDLNRRYVQ